MLEILDLYQCLLSCFSCKLEDKCLSLAGLLGDITQWYLEKSSEPLLK